MSFFSLSLYYFQPTFCIHTYSNGGQTLFALITFRSLFTYFCYLVFLSLLFSTLQLFSIAFPFPTFKFPKQNALSALSAVFVAVVACMIRTHSFEDNKLIQYILYFSSEWFLGERLLMMPPLPTTINNAPPLSFCFSSKKKTFATLCYQCSQKHVIFVFRFFFSFASFFSYGLKNIE